MSKKKDARLRQAFLINWWVPASVPAYGAHSARRGRRALPIRVAKRSTILKTATVGTAFMDRGNKKTRERSRPEFETTRTCELLSMLAEEAGEKDSSTPSNGHVPESSPEEATETNNKT